MKKIVCELCDGTEFAKENGVFVCKGCGTTYSAEEAKALMQEVEGEVPANTEATVHFNNNTQQIENLIILAETAFNSANNVEAEGYCNKAIELDVTCSKAWLLKGKAIAWQSEYGSPRVMEGANAILKAISYTPDEEKDNVAIEGILALKNVCGALASLAKENFGNNPTNGNRLKFGEFLNICVNMTNLFTDISESVKLFCDVIWKTHKQESATLMNISGVAALNTIREKWKEIDRPNDNSLRTYIDWLGEIELMFKDSINWGKDTEEDEDELIRRYKNLNIVIDEPMDMHSWKQEWNSWTSSYEWVENLSLTDEAKESRRKCIKDNEKKIRELKHKKKEKAEAEKKAAEEAKKERIKAYWEEHKEEKEKLEAEKADLIEKNRALDDEVSGINKKLKEIHENEEAESLPSEVLAADLHRKIKELHITKSKLGIFAGKEKKRIAEEITDCESKLVYLAPKIEEEKKARSEKYKELTAPLTTKMNEINNEISDNMKKISKIDSELTKDRE